MLTAGGDAVAMRRLDGSLVWRWETDEVVRSAHLVPGSPDVMVAAGNKVLYGKYSGTEVTVDGDQYLILRESDILAIVND